MAGVYPIGSWQSTIMSSTGQNQSSSMTVTVNITQGWEIQIPFVVQYSNVSADAYINVFPSMDGGATYDNTPLLSFSLPSVSLPSNRKVQSSIRLTTGQYAIQIVSSGPNSQSFQVNTQFVINTVFNG